MDRKRIEGGPRHKRLCIESGSESDAVNNCPGASIEQEENSEESDYESTSSDSSIGTIRRHANAIIPDIESSSSESDWEISPSSSKKGSMLTQLDEDSSSESDGQSDKCPICLAKFRGQEIASPDSCEHNFCFECILEWSKNVSTCPIDRQQFQLIFVKKHMDGSVIRKVSIEPPKVQETEAIQEDPTFCEVCNRCDREDRLLLCDACDAGYHLECLTPPLDSVPMGNWHCPECGPEDIEQDLTIYVDEVEVLYHDTHDMEPPRNARRTPRNIIVPRTMQSDRIRARILSNRQQNRVTANVSNHSIEVTVNNPSTSGLSTLRSTSVRRKSVKKSVKRKTKRKRVSKPRIKISYEIDEETGQKIVIKTSTGSSAKRKKRRKKRRSTRHANRRLAKVVAQTKTTKRRLAKHFGICAPRTTGQMLPDVRIQSEGQSIHSLRSNAGISFSLFGNREELDYFSDADNEDGESFIGGTGLLSRARRPNMSDARIFQRSASKKSILLPQAAESTSCDILSNIMDSQEKLLSRNSVLSITKDGTLKIDNNKNFKSEQNRNKVDVNDARNVNTRNVPNYTQQEASNTSTTNSQEYPESRTISMNSTTISNNSVSTSSGDRNSGDDRRSESEMDTYSDAETVSTSKAGEDSNKATSSPAETQRNEEKNEEVEPKKDAQEEDVSSTTNVLLNSDDPESDDEECPNFSIYSKDTINLVANRNPEQDEVGSSLDIKKASTPVEDELEPPPMPESDEDDETVHDSNEINTAVVKNMTKECHTLYSDSDEEVLKTDELNKSFGIGDIRSLTEDISEEERSYTPCLDERVPTREGLEGLDTEAISEDERNDFEEAQEQRIISDTGDALEINAKESEMDFTKPEDYEEGEIVDKRKKLEESKQNEESQKVQPNTQAEEPPAEVASFKKISKNNKDRNYRDKDRDTRSLSKDKNKENVRDNRRERKREKRKEIERYNVRNVVADKPRKATKDKFGRDARRRSSSRSSKSSTPYRSGSRGRRSNSRERQRRRRRVRSRSKTRSRSRSVSQSRSRKRSSSPRRRAPSKSKRKKKSPERSRRRNRSASRPRAERPRSASSSRRHREWEAKHRSKAWTPSLSRSRSPERHASPSWTPPRVIKKIKPSDLTVILTNDSTQKKEKRKAERKKNSAIDKPKKRRRDKTPQPSKEVFASGDNILVSVSFNKEAEEMGLKQRTKQREDRDEVPKRSRKEKEKCVEKESTPSVKKKKKKKATQDLTSVKPVAIIDLDRSPFKELTPSPKDIIVLSDSDHSPEKVVNCDSSQQPDYSLGPKTPPEPQVKFSLTSKLPQLRQITNPLHEEDDENEENDEIDPQAELEQRLNDAMHKGPNTPSEPPNSPPSSPDAYDPFDPTKSRSPTPENEQKTIELTNIETENIPLSKTPDLPKSHTPPLIMTDIQPADSQSNATLTPDENAKSASQVIPQGSSPVFTTSKGKASTPTIAYSSATSTPTSVTVVTPKVSILNSTILGPTASQTNQQRNLLPNVNKTSPLKPSPTKAAMKMMPKRPGSTSKLSKSSKNRSTDSNDSNMDLDSPYSPGPSDYEDLFEPPTEHKGGSKGIHQKSTPAPKAANKIQSTFDSLFGTSPKGKSKNDKLQKKNSASNNNNPKCKQIGVKLDEDSLKILDDLPNSAVEMQVKDKFLKKLNRQERVVEEVKLVLKPHYNKKHINKDEYKDILRRAVPKICHNKSGEINPKKIQNLIEAYVKKFRHSKKVSSSSSVNVQK